MFFHILELTSLSFIFFRFPYFLKVRLGTAPIVEMENEDVNETDQIRKVMNKASSEKVEPTGQA